MNPEYEYLLQYLMGNLGVGNLKQQKVLFSYWVL